MVFYFRKTIILFTPLFSAWQNGIFKFLSCINKPSNWVKQKLVSKILRKHKAVKLPQKQTNILNKIPNKTSQENQFILSFIRECTILSVKLGFSQGLKNPVSLGKWNRWRGMNVCWIWCQANVGEQVWGWMFLGQQDWGAFYDHIQINVRERGRYQLRLANIQHFYMFFTVGHFTVTGQQYSFSTVSSFLFTQTCWQKPHRHSCISVQYSSSQGKKCRWFLITVPKASITIC